MIAAQHLCHASIKWMVRWYSFGFACHFTCNAIHVCAKILQFSHGVHSHPSATYYSEAVETVGNDICDVVRVYFQACHRFHRFFFLILFFSAKNYILLYSQHEIPNLRDFSAKNNAINSKCTLRNRKDVEPNMCVWCELVLCFACVHLFHYHFSKT